MNEKLSKRDHEGGTGEPAENSASGLNDNLEFLGKQLHVQTERIGFPTPRIVTEVFSNGRVVFSKKNELPAQGSDSREFAKVQDLMRTQHLQTIHEIQEKQKQILGSSLIP
jgi:hypothetical protein